MKKTRYLIPALAVLMSAVLSIPVFAEDEPLPVLPMAGGIGTTIFYVVGGILVVLAIVLLITKNRVDK